MFPEQTAIIHGALRRSYAEFYARTRQLASALTRRGIGRGDTVSVAARQHARHAGVPLRRAHDRRGAQHHQHPARCPDHCLSARSWRGEGADRRSRVLQGWRRKRWLWPRRNRSSSITTTPSIPARASGSATSNTRSFVAARRPRLCLERARRRMGCHLAQLYLGHHRRSQGRRLPPSRRLPPGHRQCAYRRHAQALRLSLDAADVPLQRLVLSVDPFGGGRHPCVPAPGARAGDLRSDRRATR